MSSKYDGLKSAIALGRPEEIVSLKEKYYMLVINELIDELAWQDKDRKKPSGVNAIRSGLMDAIKTEYKDLVDFQLASGLCSREAAMYY